MDIHETDEQQKDVALKLAFAFLDKKDLLKSVDLVCKGWKSLAASDHVWAWQCAKEMELMEVRRENWKKRRPDEDVERVDMPMHKLMERELRLKADTGRSCRQIFVLCSQMGAALDHHKYYGPDHININHRQGTTTSLRQASLQAYQSNVFPAIERLRGVFGEPRQFLRPLKNHLSIVQTRARLLALAQADPWRNNMVKRMMPIHLTKEDLARRAAEDVLAMATLISQNPGEPVLREGRLRLDENFNGTFGDLIGAFNRVAGKEVTLRVATVIRCLPSSELERSYDFDPAVRSPPELAPDMTTKPAGPLEWPISPIDSLFSLIKRIWVDEEEVSYQMRVGHATQEAAFDAHIQNKWWPNLPANIRQTLVDIYRERDNNAFPDFADPMDIPLQNLRIIASNPLFKNELEKIIWDAMVPQAKSGLLDVYRRKSKSFADAIAREYSSVYEGSCPEESAAALLNIYLAIPKHPQDEKLPNMTSAYCRDFPSRMENAMNRWNVLASAATSNTEVRWQPGTLAELKALESKFPRDCNYADGGDWLKEFSVSHLAEKFLLTTLTRRMFRDTILSTVK